MALQTSEILTAVSFIPPLVAPVIPVLLQRRDSVRRANWLADLDKRLQLVERLLALGDHIPVDQRVELQAELRHIAEELISEEPIEPAREDAATGGTSRLKRWLLLYEQPTLRATIYRGFAWFFWTVGTLGTLSVSAVAARGDGGSEWPFAVFGGVVYLVVGWFFRSAAVRQQKPGRSPAERAPAASVI